MQMEYKNSKEELASLQGDLDQQLHSIRERRGKLQDQEAELKAEEARLVQLRSTNTREEDLLKKQTTELKEVIQRERATLESLKEYVISPLKWVLIIIEWGVNLIVS